MTHQQKSVKIDGIDFVWGRNGLNIWTWKICLPSWANYSYRRFRADPGSYVVTPDEAAKGVVQINIEPDDMNYRPINDIEKSTLKWLSEHHWQVTDSITGEIFSLYPEWQKHYQEENPGFEKGGCGG